MALAILGGLTSATRLASSLTSIGSVVGIKKSKDPGRLAANQRALAQVMQGGANLTFENQGVTALQFLLVKSPVKYGGQGGWATAKAQEDAWAKYQQAKAFLAQKGGSGTTTTTSLGGTYGIGNSGSQTGTPRPSGVSANGGPLGEKTTGYVVVGLGILAALYLVRGK